MTEELERTGAFAIGARLKNYEKISDFSMRQDHAPRQGIERSAKRSNNIHSFLTRSAKFVEDCDRIIALDGLTEIARCGQVMIHPPVNDDKLLAARGFDIKHPSDVNTAFAH